MRRYFADAFYWVALFSPRDQWHSRVLAFEATLDDTPLYTTDEVLTEFLAFYSATDPVLRTRAALFVETILQAGFPISSEKFFTVGAIQLTHREGNSRGIVWHLARLWH